MAIFAQRCIGGNLDKGSSIGVMPCARPMHCICLSLLRTDAIFETSIQEENTVHVGPQGIHIFLGGGLHGWVQKFAMCAGTVHVHAHVGAAVVLRECAPKNSHAHFERISHDAAVVLLFTIPECPCILLL